MQNAFSVSGKTVESVALDGSYVYVIYYFEESTDLTFLYGKTFSRIHAGYVIKGRIGNKSDRGKATGTSVMPAAPCPRGYTGVQESICAVAMISWNDSKRAARMAAFYIWQLLGR